MGRSARPRPERLTEKLLQIRLALGLSQNEILANLGLREKLSRAAVSGYEAGTIEPPLHVGKSATRWGKMQVPQCFL